MRCMLGRRRRRHCRVQGCNDGAGLGKRRLPQTVVAHLRRVHQHLRLVMLMLVLLLLLVWMRVLVLVLRVL